MLTTIKAIVLNAIKYGEADLIVKCFTYEAGTKSYLLRGILKSKKGKLKPAYFQPLTQLKITANHKLGNKLNSIREVEIVNHYTSIFNDIPKQAITLFISEILVSCVQEEEQNESLYHYIENSLIWLDLNSNIANFHLYFLINLTKYLGFYPDKTNINGSFFDLNEGLFLDFQPKFEYISGEKLTILKQLLGIDFDELDLIQINSKMRYEFLTIIIRYFELHLSGFRKPKSLSVLKSVFS